MAERVFLHLGVPKSGTTYLQSTLWAHQDELAAQGVLLPGGRRQAHTWASFAVRDDPVLAQREKTPGTWERLVAEVRQWPGTAVLSHEFLGAASAEQARRALAAFAPAEVHLVVTARDALGLLTASWQEALKYRATTTLEEHDRGVSEDPLDVWGWRSLDAAEVLSRWAVDVPPDRVHVVVRPRHAPARDTYWQRFGGLFLADPGRLDPAASGRNASMGLVESELLRTLNHRVPDARTLPTHGWVRDYLADGVLARRRSEPFHPSPARIEECRQRSDAMVESLRAGGFHVVGDLEDLRVGAVAPRRTPEDVTTEELVDAFAEVLSDVLVDLRSTTGKLRRSQRRRPSGTPDGAAAPSAGAARRVARGLRRVWRRS